LNESDTASLPSFDVKTKKLDKRYNWFVENYGEQAWELDAMNPNDLRTRVRGEILLHVDSDAWEQHQRVEEVQQQSVKAIAERMTAAVA
jgi:hypothetical protein